MNIYLHALRAEYWKFARTWSMVLWLITPILLLLGHFIALFLRDLGGYRQYVSFFAHESPWHYIYQSYAYIQCFIWPLLTAFLATTLVSQELKSELWQRCPIAIHRQLWSKWLLLAILIATGLVLGWMAVAFGSYLLSITMLLPFNEFQADIGYMSMRFLQLYPILLAIGTLHFWVSINSRAHILLNMTLPLVLLLIGSYSPYGLLWSWWQLHTHHLQMAIEQQWASWTTDLSVWTSFHATALFMLCLIHFIGYFIFKKKKSWILSQ